MEPIRVLIVDDHAYFRKGLRALLKLLPEVAVVGEAADGDEAVAQTTALQPDVVLMDLHMPGRGGLSATEELTRSSPHVGVLLLTMVEDDEALAAGLRVGARGYVLKGADREELGRAIRSVRNGEAIFSPAMAQRLAGLFSRPQRAIAPPFPELSEREREVLALVGQGLSNGEIASRLVISGKTVRNHITNIFAKLGVSERSEAIARARGAGLA
jgi:DNA-binding NarL/FixJ family response regulator